MEATVDSYKSYLSPSLISPQIDTSFYITIYAMLYIYQIRTYHTMRPESFESRPSVSLPAGRSA